MAFKDNKYGCTSISVQCVGFALYAFLEILGSAGLIHFPFGRLNLLLARFSFSLLILSVVFGIVGLAFDKKKTPAMIAVCLVVPVFVVMVMISGYW